MHVGNVLIRASKAKALNSSHHPNGSSFFALQREVFRVVTWVCLKIGWPKMLYLYTYIHTLHTYIHTYIHYIHTLHTYITYIHYIHTLHTYITYIHTYIHTYITLHYITLHYITLHYITLHYIHTYIHTYICIYIYIIMFPYFPYKHYTIWYSLCPPFSDTPRIPHEFHVIPIPLCLWCLQKSLTNVQARFAGVTHRHGTLGTLV